MAAIVLFVAMVGVSGLSMVPAKEISYQAGSPIGSRALIPKHLVRMTSNMLAGPWWPISAEFPRRFQEIDTNVAPYLLAIAPVVLFAYWRIFRRDRNQLLLMALTFTFGTLFVHIVYVGHVRNWGIMYISFLLALWMQKARAVETGAPNADAWSRWTYLLMGASVVAGVIAVASSWVRPYSRAKEAAAWIKANEPPNVALVGAPDVSFATVVEELDRPAYFMECNCVDTFKLFSRDRDLYVPELLADHLVVASEEFGEQSRLRLLPPL